MQMPSKLLSKKDRDDGLTPFFVSATVGTTSSMAMDPILSIIDAAEGCWIHVDAAMAGTAAMCEEFRWIHEGLERADSYCFNPHKWMFTNFDCDCLLGEGQNGFGWGAEHSARIPAHC